jgi:hypothetical protein
MIYHFLSMVSLAYRLSQITFRCIDWIQGIQHLKKLLKSIYFAARHLRSRNLDRSTILRLDNDSLTAKEAFIYQQWFVLFLAAVTDDWRLAFVWCGAITSRSGRPEGNQLCWVCM